MLLFYAEKEFLKKFNSNLTNLPAEIFGAFRNRRVKKIGGFPLSCRVEPAPF